MTNDAMTSDEGGLKRLLRSATLFSSFAIRLSPCVMLLAIGHPLAATEALATQVKPAPFLCLRETRLSYHGASVDFTNLTEIRIGWFGPTNLSDSLTGDLWWAADFAIREANGQSAQTNSSFASLPFRLVPCWSVDPWGTGVSQLARMVYDEQPLALLGSVDSATTHLAEQVVAKANLPLVSPIATDKSITLAGVSWMFSCAPSDAAIASALVGDIVAVLNGKAARSGIPAERDTLKTSTDRLRCCPVTPSRLALLTCTDHESRMTAREVMKELSHRGCPSGFRFEVPPGAKAPDQQISALAATHPTAVLVIAGAEDAARLVQGIRAELGSVAIFGSHSMGCTRFREVASEAAEGVRFPLFFSPNSADTNATSFMARFESERNYAPDYAAAFTYDATRLLVEAIRRAGPNRTRIREAITRLSPWPGIAGPIQFDGTGQNRRTNIGIGIIRNGTIVPLPARANLANSTSNQSQP